MKATVFSGEEGILIFYVITADTELGTIRT